MKTVKVRIAVGVDSSGDWNSCGCSGMSDGESFSNAVDTLESGEARYIITAELPVPEANEVAGTVEKVDDESSSAEKSSEDK